MVEEKLALVEPRVNMVRVLHDHTSTLPYMGCIKIKLQYMYILIMHVYLVEGAEWNKINNVNT